MRKVVLKAFLLLLLFSGFTSMAQNSQSSLSEDPQHQLHSFVSTQESLNRMYPQERVYLHLDNASYFLGDTLWFKGYVTQSGQNRTGTVSTVLYVELLTQEGTLVDSRKLKLEEGQCHGEIAFPSHCPAGFYEIRAYTRYMMNWGGDWAFSRVLPVYDKPHDEGDYSQTTMTGYSYLRQYFPKRGEPDKKAKSPSVNVRFFPEGGSLVLGVPSRVAFQVTDGNGLGMDALLTFPSKTVPSVRVTEHGQGMGTFDYTPGKDKVEAEVAYRHKRYRFKLPRVLKQGYTLRLDTLEPTKVEPALHVWLRRSSGLKPELLGVSVFCRGNCSWFRTLSMDGDSLLLSIPSDSLAGGVNRITLFDSNGQTLCERMFFVQPVVNQYVSLLTEKKVYRPFEKIDLTFGAVPGSVFSLSVRDRAGETVTSRANILTDMLLSSEVRGYIPDAQYYFEDPTDPVRRSSLDLLLLVQGWRRYDLPQNKDSLSLFPLRAEEGLILEGRVVPDQNDAENQTLTGKIKKKIATKERLSPPARLEDVLLYMEDLKRKEQGEPYRMTVRLDSSGRFRLHWPDFVGKSSFCLSLVDRTNSADTVHANRFRILLDRVFDPSPRPYNSLETKLENLVMVKPTDPASDPGFSNVPENQRRTDEMQLLKQVSVEAKRKDPPTAFFVFDVDRDKIRWRDQGVAVPSRFWTYLKKKGLPAEQVSSSNTGFYGDIDPFARFQARAWVRYHDPEDEAKWVRGTKYQGNVNGYFLKDSYLDMGFLDASDYLKILSGRMFLQSPNTDLWESQHPTMMKSYLVDMDNEKKLRDIRPYYPYEREEFLTDQTPIDRVNKIILYDNKRRFSYSEEQNHGTYYTYLTDLFFVKYPKSAFVDDMPIPNIRLTQMEGYSMPKAFSSGKAKPMPGDVDFRRTLYWNPDVQVDSTGQASVSFYNNGRCRDIVVSAEGLTPDGSPLVLK